MSCSSQQRVRPSLCLKIFDISIKRSAQTFERSDHILSWIAVLLSLVGVQILFGLGDFSFYRKKVSKLTGDEQKVLSSVSRSLLAIFLLNWYKVYSFTQGLAWLYSFIRSSSSRSKSVIRDIMRKSLRKINFDHFTSAYGSLLRTGPFFCSSSHIPW